MFFTLLMLLFALAGGLLCLGILVVFACATLDWISDNVNSFFEAFQK